VGNRSRALMIGLGVFFVGVAALARFYAYPTLAVAPADQIAHTVSAGSDATIFSIAELKEKGGVELESRRTVRGDVAAADKISKALDRKVVVFDTAVVTDDSKNYQFPDDASKTELMPLSFVQERVVLDAHTGEAVRWNPSGDDNSGEYISTTLEKTDRLEPDQGSALFKGHEGLVLKFPFGTEKKTYKFWDSTLRKAFPIQFKDEATIDGLKVYVFEQEVPQQEVPLAKPLMVPGNLVDEPGRDSVEVQRTYKNTRTLWIEPITGAIIKGQEQQHATIAYNGEDKLIATQVTIAYDDATVTKNVKGATENGVAEGGYQSKASQLNLIGFWVPLGALIVGLLLFGFVGFRQLRSRT
jgi:Porin PorA